MDKKLFWKGFLAGIVIVIALGIFAFIKLTGSPDVTLDEIKMEDLQGNKLESETLLDGKPLVLNFWATWCAPCVAEFPEFENAKLKYAGKVNFVMISDEEAAKISGFKAKKGFQLTILKSSLPLSNYGINAIPQTYFYDAKGELVETISGSTDATGLEEKIQKLLKK